MKKNLGKWLIFLLSAGLVLLLGIYYPELQNRFPALQGRPLAGAFTVTRAPRLTLKNWLSRDFQNNVSNTLKEDPKIRPLFVRLKNEWLFRMFGTEAHDVLEMGRDGYLFDKTYIRASLGLDYKGDEFITEKATKLEQLHQYLKNKGKALILLMPPAKAGHIPEKIPASYDNIKPQTSNRQALIQACQQKNIPYLDCSHLITLEKQMGWEMYPVTGLHWSHLGATWAADSLVGKIEELLPIRMPQMQFDSLTITNQLRSPDQEFGELLNLLRPYPYDSMAYPVIHYQSDSNTDRPKVLILGDSYYRVMYDMGIQAGLFDQGSQYWHYFEQFIAPQHEGGVAVDKSPENIRKILDEMDVILYVASETNLHRIGFGFTEAALAVVGD